MQSCHINQASKWPSPMNWENCNIVLNMFCERFKHLFIMLIMHVCIDISNYKCITLKNVKLTYFDTVENCSEKKKGRIQILTLQIKLTDRWCFCLIVTNNAHSQRCYQSYSFTGDLLWLTTWNLRAFTILLL